MFKTKLLILWLCFFSGILSAQKTTNDYPVFEKVKKAKSKIALKDYAILQATSMNLRAEGITEATLKDGILLDLNLNVVKDLQRQNPDALQLSFPLTKQKNVKVNLVRNKVMTPDFILRQSSNIKQEMNYSPGLYYTGVVENDPSSLVSISIFKDEIIGTIHTTDGNFVIGKMKAKNSDKHIIYNDTDLTNPIGLDCATEDDGVVYRSEDLTFNMSRAVGDCIRIYIEIDDDIVTNKGGTVGATNYITGVMNEVITLYANDNLTMAVSEILAWDTPAPYSGSSSSAMLSSFQANTGNFNGDLSHLVSYQASGGIAAGFSGICNSNVDNSKCFSSINSSYSNVPTYSYTVMVMAHEMGHLIGSRHTHACVWNGNGTAIDGCAGFTEGGCALPNSPAGGGTIMSYCHVTTGIDFTQGFGPQPQAVLLNTVANANCLSACSGPTCDDGVQNGDETGIDCGGASCPDCDTNCDDNIVNVNFIFDNYPEETSWSIVDAGGTTVASGGTYGNQADGSSLTIPLCLLDGCFDFTIFDTYGDGICCGFGNGSYSVTDENGDVLVSGGTFTNTETTNFCLGNTNDPLTVDLTATNVTCFGGNDGSATASAAGGSGTYTYSWSNGATTMTINGLTASTYSATVSDGTNSAVASIEVLDGTPNTYYADTDGDGFGDAANSTQGGCTPPAGYVTDNTDCDDGNAAVNPSATEVCDGIDNNCNGQIDEQGLNTYYADTDGDGFGDAANSTESCTQPNGYVTDNTDCDDGNAAVNPGATEVCDGIDNNCNGQTDEGLLNTYYADTDGDGFGDPANTTASCTQPSGYVTDNTDCDDTNANIYIGATCDDGNPNTDGDVYDANCNCIGTPTAECTENEVTFTLTLDNWPQETSWQLADGNGAVLYSGGTYPGQNGVTISEAFCLPDGCYDFTMFDTYGDGICCAYGNGSYELVNEDGLVLASGGAFGAQELTNFCVPDETYCESVSGSTNYEWIENVTIGNVNNTSGNNDGYADFSDLIVNAQAGETVALSIEPGFGSTTYSETFVVWIDYNNDFDFDDAGEEVFTATDNQTVTGSFTIPNDAAATTRIRVAMRWGGTPSACDGFSYGEVEDYTLAVSAGQGLVGDGANDRTAPTTGLLNTGNMSLRVFPNPVKDWLNVEAQVIKEESTQFSVVDMQGRVLMNVLVDNAIAGKLNERIDLSTLPSGLYFLRMTNGKEQLTKRFYKE